MAGMQIMKTGLGVTASVRVDLGAAEVLLMVHAAKVSLCVSVDMRTDEARALAAELIAAAEAREKEKAGEARSDVPACYRRGEVGELGPACSKCPFAACETCAHWNGEVF